MSDYRPRSVALTGATGQLGRAWLREMAQQHPDVHLRLLVRPRSPGLRGAIFRRSLVLENEDATSRSLAHLFARAVELSRRRAGRRHMLRQPCTSEMNMVSERFVISTMWGLRGNPPPAEPSISRPAGRCVWRRSGNC